MLTLQAVGPTPEGQFLVVYRTPGCCVQTVACVCTTLGQADDEAARLKVAQVTRERALRNDRQLRGLGGVYPGLDCADT